MTKKAYIRHPSVKGSAFPSSRIKAHIEPGKWNHLRLVKCVQCSRGGTWSDPTWDGSSDPVVIAGFRSKNWEMDNVGGGICPTCLDRPEVKEARNVIRAPGSEEPCSPAAPVFRDPPRSSTRADIRRIIDELDACYDLDRQRYTGTNTDASVAARLDVPRAWVTEERERSFGPAENEEALRHNAEIDAMLAEIKTALEAVDAATEKAGALWRKLELRKSA